MNKDRKAHDLRSKAVEKLAARLPVSEPCADELDVKRLLHELQVHQVELEMQNEELELQVKERTAALIAANEQIKQISFQLLEAEERERLRIAAELHDQVGQSLLLAKMKADALASDAANAGDEVRVTDISSLLEGCIQDIRNLTFSMRPPLLDTAGIRIALEWLCQSIKESYRVQVDFSYCCQSITLNSEMRNAIYQAVRELLLNVAKHAGVPRAQLAIKTEGRDLMVQVSDSGNGFETSSRSCSSVTDIGFGLFNVQQRVKLMGGRCLLDAKPGQGTVVTLTIPMGYDLQH